MALRWRQVDDSQRGGDVFDCSVKMLDDEPVSDDSGLLLAWLFVRIGHTYQCGERVKPRCG